MSEYELDDDEIASLYEDDPDSLSPEDVFNMVLINKRDKKKVSVVLVDEEGDEIDLAEMLEELVGYVKDKMQSEEGNQLTEQIMPLMSQSLVSGLGRLIGINATAFFITNPNTRMALIYMMMVAFTLYKMVQVKDLTIHTIEEEVSDEEIDEIERKSQASSVANMASMLGVDPREAVKSMIERGDLTEEDFTDLFGKSEESEDDEDSNE